MFDVGTYFEEHKDDTVKGFTIIDHGNDGSYQIGEKWLRENDDDMWVQYTVPATKLQERIENDECEPKGQLTDNQLARVREKVGLSPIENATMATADD